MSESLAESYDVARLVRWLKHSNLFVSCNHSHSTAFCLTHTELTQRLLSAPAGQGSCVYCFLPALSLLYATRRGSWGKESSRQT